MASNTPAIIYVTFDLLYFAIRGYWANKADKRPVVEKKSFLLDKINIGLVGVFTMIVPLFALFSHWLGRFDYQQNTTLTFLSIPVLLAGLACFWIAHRDLGEYWSVTLELKTEHKLVTNGIFGYIRHPMYTSIWLCALGQVLDDR